MKHWLGVFCRVTIQVLARVINNACRCRVLLGAVLFSFAGLLLAQSYELDAAAALINNDVVTKKELAKQMKLFKYRLQARGNRLPDDQELKQQVLDFLINQSLQTQVAARYELTVDEPRVQQIIAQFAREQGQTIAQLKQTLHEKGIAYSAFSDEIRQEILISDIQRYQLRPKVNISPDELNDAVKLLKKTLDQKTQYHLGMILIATPEDATSQQVLAAQAQAKHVLQQLKAGADFQQLAIAQSNGQDALRAGDLGWRTLSEVPSLFVSTVKAMDVNTIKGPFHSGAGYHIIKLIDKKNTLVSVAPVPEYHVRQILITPTHGLRDVDARQKLTDLRRRLTHGESFSVLAKAYSDDMASAVHGGDMGWISERDVEPNVFGVITALSHHTLSPVVHAAKGWYLIEVMGKRMQKDNIDKLKAKANQHLFAKKMQVAIQDWIMQLRDTAHIAVVA